MANNSLQIDNAKTKQGKEINRVQYYSGNIPHPGIVKDWELICPGAADRILSLTEKQSSHRQLLENQLVKSSVTIRYLGLGFTVLMCIIITIIGVILTINGSWQGGIGFVATGIIGPTITFLLQRLLPDTKSENKPSSNPSSAKIKKRR